MKSIERAIVAKAFNRQKGLKVVTPFKKEGCTNIAIVLRSNTVACRTVGHEAVGFDLGTEYLQSEVICDRGIEYQACLLLTIIARR